MGIIRNSECWYKNVCNLECSNSCIRFIEMKHLMDSSGLPKNKQVPITLDGGVDYEQYCRLAEIKNNIVEFVNKGRNLYITSPYTGNGKTSWAIKLMLKYFDEIWAGNGLRTRALFVHVPTFILKAKNFADPLSEEYKHNLLCCDLVVWDDIAGTDLSSYDYTQLLMYIDNRILANKSNIFTSNIYDIKDLANAISVRLSSRVYNTSEVIVFSGKDRRNKNGTIADIE